MRHGIPEGIMDYRGFVLSAVRLSAVEQKVVRIPGPAARSTNR